MMCANCKDLADDWTEIRTNYIEVGWTDDSELVGDIEDLLQARDMTAKKHVAYCTPGCTCQHRISL